MSVAEHHDGLRTSVKPSDDAAAACPFCALLTDGASADLVPLSTPDVFVVPAMKQRRRNRGHVLVLPRRHVTRLADMDGPLLQVVYAVAGRVSLAVRRAFGATGATLFQNDDAPDQVLLHVHVHVVPRWPGDAFRLPDPTSEVLPVDERLRQAALLRQVLADLAR